MGILTGVRSSPDVTLPFGLIADKRARNSCE